MRSTTNRISCMASISPCIAARWWPCSAAMAPGVPPRSGRSWDSSGNEVVQWPTHRVARLGVGYCPEERGIFSSLTTEENLMLPPRLTSEGMNLDEIYTIFPNLKERRHSQGTRLSGGEQQMLAMARILRAGARLLLLDEISEGLAPVIVQKLSEVIQKLKERGFTILLIEQNFRFASKLADRMYVVERGRIAAEIAKHEMQAKQSLLEELLGV